MRAVALADAVGLVGEVLPVVPRRVLNLRAGLQAKLVGLLQTVVQVQPKICALHLPIEVIVVDVAVEVGIPQAEVLHAQADVLLAQVVVQALAVALAVQIGEGRANAHVQVVCRICLCNPLARAAVSTCGDGLRCNLRLYLALPVVGHRPSHHVAHLLEIGVHGGVE